jgi:hypothetical protein
MNMAEFEIQWEAPEYEYREKSVSWYWTSIIIAALVIAFSVWQKNFLFGFFVVVAEMLFIVWGSKVPRTVTFSITETGIAIEAERKFHAFKDFESVSVDPLDDEWAEVAFTFRAKLKTPFKVMFPRARLGELRDAMKAVLKEIPYEPTLLDSIEKLLRF